MNASTQPAAEPQSTQPAAAPVRPVRGAFRTLHRLRVRWAEVDLQGIVFNGHYLMYLDTAVADHWRGMGLPYVESMQRLGGDLYVKRAALDYSASARLDDLLDIGIRCLRVGRSSLQFQGAVFVQDRLLVTGELIYVFADPATQKSRAVPAELRAIVEAYEAGEAMTQVRTGSWAELGDDARAIREEVFVREQGIALELEVDAADASCLHAVAYNRLGMPLATARLVQEAPGVAKLGRMAVRQTMRGGGVGSAVLDALCEAARTSGHTQLHLHAQLSAQTFYLRRGFTAQGPVFAEDGIDHVAMRRPLGPANP